MNTTEKILKLMSDKNITAYQLSKELGITESLFSHWKNGLQKPKSDAIIKIAAYFNVSTDYLLGLTEVKSSVPAIFDFYSALSTTDRVLVDGYIKKLHSEAQNPSNAIENTIDVKSKSVKA